MKEVLNDFQRQRMDLQNGTGTVTANGVTLAYEIHGTGEIPLIMVHGGWFSRGTWDRVVPQLAESFRVVTYDRRGHGDSDQESGQGSVRKHVGDLIALIEHLGLAPVWVAGQSFGGAIALWAAGERPDLLQGIIVHEPPLFSLIDGDPAVAPLIEKAGQILPEVTDRIASGDHTGAAEQFVEELLGQGLWTQLPPDIRQMVIEHAPAFLEEAQLPDENDFELEWVSNFARPILLTLGDQSAPLFAAVNSRLSEAASSLENSTFEGLGHAVHVEDPDAYAESLTAFVSRHTKE
jgi:pimeloyl-ACP methyl ester carboxylesterase